MLRLFGTIVAALVVGNVFSYVLVDYIDMVVTEDEDEEDE